jgi:hypothetical protein
MEEADAPDQILIGSMDRRHCILLALGLFLEVRCEAALGLGNKHLFGESGILKRAKGTICKILNVCKILNEVCGKAEFVRLVPEPLGTHRIWKSPATHDRHCGCSKDDTCVGGACMHQLKPTGVV